MSIALLELRSNDAWEALIRRYDRVVRGAARSCGLNAADVDDVAQSTWMRLHESLAGIRHPAALGGWLSTTARREALAVCQRRRCEPLEEAADAAAPEADSLDWLQADERRAAVLRAAAALPPRRRAIFSAFALDPARSYSEIAELLQIPLGSIGPTRQRLIEQLRENPHVRAVA
jgi:RNA polymerase sigma factor (sigma-70 family)